MTYLNNRLMPVQREKKENGKTHSDHRKQQEHKYASMLSKMVCGQVNVTVAERVVKAGSRLREGKKRGVQAKRRSQDLCGF